MHKPRSMLLEDLKEQPDVTMSRACTALIKCG